MLPGRDLVRSYVTALREEPKVRAYLAGALLDDIGVAVSAWGMRLLMTNLFTDQRERAKLMLPTLCCFLLGCILGGPLADWGARTFPQGLARWRWKLVVWARVIETVALGLAILGVAGEKPSIPSMLPYYMIAAFMKTALRPTRIAFQVDLLRQQETQVDSTGAEMLDEEGRPRVYKPHLLAFDAMTEFLRAAAILAGLFLGGQILSAAGGKYTPLLVVDVGTNLLFVAAIYFGCHPDKDRGVAFADLLRDRERGAALRSERSFVVHAFVEFWRSLVEAVRFLSRREQRPLVWLITGGLIVEVVNEFYDGKMMIKHVLKQGNEALRWSEIGWSIAAVVTMSLLPVLARKVGSLGKIFLCLMAVDGVFIALGGRLAMGGAAASLVPFVVVLGFDHTCTAASGALAGLAQNSASSAGMRGRIAAASAVAAILLDMGAEATSTAISEAIGIPAMLQWIGVVQVGLMVVIAIAGGSALWNYGLRAAPEAPAKEVEPAAA